MSFISGKNASCVQLLMFFLYDNEIQVVEKYKYLGFHFDSHLDFKEGIDILSNAAGRALGGIIAKFKPLKESDYNAFSKLYESEVPILGDLGSRKT